MQIYSVAFAISRQTNK